jgi:hypothetical protein
MRCTATTSSGTPCASPPAFVNPSTGLCPAHDPARADARSRAARRGGEVVAEMSRKRRLLPSDLPPLDTPAAAAVWAETIGVAAATGKIPATSAQAALRAVQTFVRAHEQGELRNRLDALKQELERLRTEHA